MTLSETDFEVSTDRSRINFDFVHKSLSGESYWAEGRAEEITRKAIENSMPFGAYHKNIQVGFARVVTDYATFAWICDVFVAKDFRGKGIGKLLMSAILAHSELQGFKRWVLATKDAQKLYSKFGFTELEFPQRWMEKTVEGYYR